MENGTKCISNLQYISKQELTDESYNLSISEWHKEAEEED